MGSISLKQLKEENAEPKVDESLSQEVTQELQTDVAELEVIKENVAEDADGNKTEVEVESWMQTEEANSEKDDHKTGFKPNHEAAKTRKRLTAKIQEKDSELEIAQAEIARLKQSQSSPKTITPTARPKRDDFDFDDDLYDAAVDKWNDERFEQKLNSHSQQSLDKKTEESQIQAQEKLVEGRLNDHYGRVNKLVAEGKLTQDAYEGAEISVRTTLNNAFNGNGDVITNNIISTLNSIGEGSEKVIYQLGVNPAKLAKLQELLASDQTGLSATAYLGSLQSQITEPTKRRSTSPKPGAKVDGEGGGNGPAGTMKKAYDKAGQSGDIQARISTKRKAKAQGVDVSNW